LTPRPIKYSDEAIRDVRSAYLWHKRQWHDLGRQFLDRLEEANRAIIEFPLAQPAVHRDVRMRLLRQFPYKIFYAPWKDRIFVFGVLHAGRDPEVIGRRLSGME
jgi:plasmid stabilization system protein ParE